MPSLRQYRDRIGSVKNTRRFFTVILIALGVLFSESLVRAEEVSNKPDLYFPASMPISDSCPPVASEVRRTPDLSCFTYKEVFERMDHDHDGAITQEDVREPYAQVYSFLFDKNAQNGRLSVKEMFDIWGERVFPLFNPQWAEKDMDKTFSKDDLFILFWNNHFAPMDLDGDSKIVISEMRERKEEQKKKDQIYKDKKEKMLKELRSKISESELNDYLYDVFGLQGMSYECYKENKIARDRLWDMCDRLDEEKRAKCIEPSGSYMGESEQCIKEYKDISSKNFSSAW